MVDTKTSEMNKQETNPFGEYVLIFNKFCNILHNIFVIYNQKETNYFH